MRTRQERQVRSKALTEQVIIDEMARERAVSDQSIDTEGIRIKKGAQAEDQLHSDKKRITLTLNVALPTRQHIVGALPFFIVLLLAVVLRVVALGDKPLHHDESLHGYFSMLFMRTTLENWSKCFTADYAPNCYHYDPLLHGPFQFHAIALVFKISQWLGAPEHGINSTTVRIAAVILGTALVGFPYFLRDYLGRLGAWLASLLLAVSPSLVYQSRFAREDIYMACFTLLLVVAIARYVRSRSVRWLIVGAVAFSLSYATKEATFLTAGLFASYFAGVCVWESGIRLPFRSRLQNSLPWLPRTWSPIFLLAFLGIGGLAALLFFSWLHRLSIDITTHTAAADARVEDLKQNTQRIFPFVALALSYVFLVLFTRSLCLRGRPARRRALAKYLNPNRERVLHTVVTLPWTHWFCGLLAFAFIFLLLFTALFTDMGNGIGAGIWQGIYYWIQQIPVARGGQPWYYYLILLPLYEQIGLVFGLAGTVVCLLQPTRFRLFLVCWFVGNLVLYSWGSEKMPWLVIHITVPMLLLAAIALQPLILILVSFFKEHGSFREYISITALPPQVMRAALSLLVAVFLLVLTLQNMYQVAYIHPADAPHEMLVYTQTTTDVLTVMAKIKQLDDLYGGQKRISIGATNDTLWPFSWYLRDYTNVSWGSSDCAPLPLRQYPYSIILMGGDCLLRMQDQYAGPKGEYLFHHYNMRSWWDEGYKPPPCVPNAANKQCEGQPTWGGVGPWLWLSYGDTPPAGAVFNPVLAGERGKW